MWNSEEAATFSCFLIHKGPSQRVSPHVWSGILTADAILEAKPKGICVSSRDRTGDLFKNVKIWNFLFLFMSNVHPGVHGAQGAHILMILLIITIPRNAYTCRRRGGVIHRVYCENSWQCASSFPLLPRIPLRRQCLTCLPLNIQEWACCQRLDLCNPPCLIKTLLVTSGSSLTCACGWPTKRSRRGNTIWFVHPDDVLLQSAKPLKSEYTRPD